MHIGVVIKRLREQKGWSLNRLATEAGVDGGNLSRLENGLAGVRDDSLKRICDVLGIKVWELYLAAEEGDPRKRAMLDLWDKLSPDQRDALFRLLGVHTDQQESDKKAK